MTGGKIGSRSQCFATTDLASVERAIARWHPGLISLQPRAVILCALAPVASLR